MKLPGHRLAPAARGRAAPHTLAGMPTPPATTDPPTTRETFVPPLVRAASEWAWRSIVIGVAAIAFLYLLGFLSEVVIPLTVGLLLCALLSSIHLRLARVMPRGAAAGVTVLGTLLVIAGLLALVGTQISGGFDSMSEQVSTGITQVHGSGDLGDQRRPVRPVPRADQAVPLQRQPRGRP